MNGCGWLGVYHLFEGDSDWFTRLGVVEQLPTSVSAADDMNIFIMLERVRTSQLFSWVLWNYLEQRKKCPWKRLLYFISDNYDAYMWMRNTMLLEWQYNFVSGCVAH